MYLKVSPKRDLMTKQLEVQLFKCHSKEYKILISYINDSKTEWKNLTNSFLSFIFKAVIIMEIGL